MEIILMEILLVLVVGAMCIGCFYVGARVGQKVVKGEEVKLPEIDPAKAWREREERKEAQKEQEKIDTILYNIENYNGSAAGQKDVPRG